MRFSDRSDGLGRSLIAPKIFPQELNHVLELRDIAGIEVHEGLVSFQNGGGSFFPGGDGTGHFLELVFRDTVLDCRRGRSITGIGMAIGGSVSSLGRALQLDETIQTEVLQQFQITGAGIEDVQQAVSRFLELDPKPEQDSKERAVQVGTGLQVDDKSMNAILEELLVKCFKAARVLKGTSADYPDEPEVGTTCHQNFRHLHPQIIGQGLERVNV